MRCATAQRARKGVSPRLIPSKGLPLASPFSISAPEKLKIQVWAAISSKKFPISFRFILSANGKGIFKKTYRIAS